MYKILLYILFIFKFNLRSSCVSTVFASLLPPPVPPMPSALLQIHDFFLINMVNSYSHICAHVFLNLLSIAHMYMCLGLTSWDWIIYQGLTSEDDRFSCFHQALVIDSFSSMCGAFEISPIHTGMSAGVDIEQTSFSSPHYPDFMGAASL